MRRAEWTLNPAVEREFVQTRRGRLRRRRVGWALTVSTLFSCPFFYIGFIAWNIDGPYVPAWLLGALGAVDFILLIAWSSLNNQDFDSRRIRLLALRTEFAEASGALVEMTIYRGAAPTGRDQGVVWPEDDRLYFTGRRTSFGLAPEDVRETIREGRTLQGVRSGLTLDLASGVSIGFDALTDDPDPALAQERLAWDLRRWLRRRGSGGQGPPLAFGPDAPCATVLGLRALGAVAFWVGAGMGLVAAALAGGIVGLTFAGIGSLGVALVLPEAWAPAERWRAWKDRRRLESR